MGRYTYADFIADIRHIFQQKGSDRLTTAELISYLKAEAERPWSEWWPERAPREIAKVLKPFGIRSRKVRVGADTWRRSWAKCPHGWHLNYKPKGGPHYRFREHRRHRRLQDDEETRLLHACGPHLRALVEAALESGCRRGELLSLQWWQVRWDQNELYLPAGKTKAKQDRFIPITQRLRAVLEMRRLGPDGKEFSSDAYVFGNESGQRVRSIKTAWSLTCQRAQITGLHFHDLRREAASRLLEGHVPEHYVQAFLGHADLTTTSAYLATTRKGLHQQFVRYEQWRSQQHSQNPQHQQQPQAQQPQLQDSHQANSIADSPPPHLESVAHPLHRS